MSCAPHLVTAYVDGELEPSYHDPLRLHLLFCPSCTAQAISEEELRARLRALADPPLPLGTWAPIRRDS